MVQQSPTFSLRKINLCLNRNWISAFEVSHSVALGFLFHLLYFVLLAQMEPTCCLQAEFILSDSSVSPTMTVFPKKTALVQLFVRYQCKPSCYLIQSKSKAAARLLPTWDLEYLLWLRGGKSIPSHLPPPSWAKAQRCVAYRGVTCHCPTSARRDLERCIPASRVITVSKHVLEVGEEASPAQAVCVWGLEEDEEGVLPTRSQPPLCHMADAAATRLISREGPRPTPGLPHLYHSLPGKGVFLSHRCTVFVTVSITDDIAQCHPKRRKSTGADLQVE